MKLHENDDLLACLLNKWPQSIDHVTFKELVDMAKRAYLLVKACNIPTKNKVLKEFYDVLQSRAYDISDRLDWALEQIKYAFVGVNVFYDIKKKRDRKIKAPTPYTP